MSTAPKQRPFDMDTGVRDRRQKQPDNRLSFCQMGRHVGQDKKLPVCPGVTPTGTVCGCWCHYKDKSK